MTQIRSGWVRILIQSESIDNVAAAISTESNTVVVALTNEVENFIAVVGAAAPAQVFAQS